MVVVRPARRPHQSQVWQLVSGEASSGEHPGSEMLGHVGWGPALPQRGSGHVHCAAGKWAGALRRDGAAMHTVLQVARPRAARLAAWPEQERRGAAQRSAAQDSLAARCAAASRLKLTYGSSPPASRANSLGGTHGPAPLALLSCRLAQQRCVLHAARACTAAHQQIMTTMRIWTGNQRARNCGKRESGRTGLATRELPPPPPPPPTQAHHRARHGHLSICPGCRAMPCRGAAPAARFPHLWQVGLEREVHY
jgi:hypothetical protein